VRLKQIDATNVPPIKRFNVNDLNDVVVFAGPNGVGKTRLIQAILHAFQSPTGSAVRLVVEATCPKEKNEWAGKTMLDTRDPQDAQRLAQTLQRAKRRANWESSVIQFESDRSIQQIVPYQFSWDYTDPFEEGIGWNYTFGGLKQRFSDTVHSLFRKVRAQREAIATRAETLQKQGQTTMHLDFADPLRSFKDAFSQLLAPKMLMDADPRHQQLKYSSQGQEFQIDALSSGEREVVNIVFDFLLRHPSDCIVFFDEPELHLHPELSYKLLQTLRSVGPRNQFIFCTHSPEIITASLDNSVIFVAPPKDSAENQAIVVREDDETNQALKLLGQSIGIVALGKRIVLIEGTQASLDKQTYGAILRNRYPNLVLVPCGGKAVLTSFSSAVSAVLDRTIWGVQFFMLCDKDALPTDQQSEQLKAAGRGRLRVLPRYHLENYFLDETVIAASFAEMEPDGSWLRSPEQVCARLVEIARRMTSYAAALAISMRYRLSVGNLDIMPGGVDGKSADELSELLKAKAQSERTRIMQATEDPGIDDAVRSTMNDLAASLREGSDDWKIKIPGRPLFNQFAHAANLDPSRLKQMYLAEALRQGGGVFQDIFDIFGAFDSM
jgi:predicted ATPase